MKKSIRCENCPWFNKKEFKCSINNEYSDIYSSLCLYINEDYSITNYGLKAFYFYNDIKSDCIVFCGKCPYYDKNNCLCKIEAFYVNEDISFECMNVNKDYSLTKEGKKKLLEENI